jgi:hypothetical protein
MKLWCASILKREVRFYIYRFSQGRVLSCISLWWTGAGQSSADLRMHVLPKFVYCVLSGSLLYVSLKGHAFQVKTCLSHPYEYWVNWLKCWHISGVPEVRVVNATAGPVSKTSLCGYFYSGNSFQIAWTTCMTGSVFRSHLNKASSPLHREDILWLQTLTGLTWSK